MDRYKEIKRILAEYEAQVIKACPSIVDKNKYARQICLADEPKKPGTKGYHDVDKFYKDESKPDEGRLLTNKEPKRARPKDWHGYNNCLQCEKAVARAQLALGQKHEQARVENIFRELEAAMVVEKLPYRDGGTLICIMPDDTWHAIRDKYLK